MPALSVLALRAPLLFVLTRSELALRAPLYFVLTPPALALQVRKAQMMAEAPWAPLSFEPTLSGLALSFVPVLTVLALQASILFVPTRLALAL